MIEERMCNSRRKYYNPLECEVGSRNVHDFFSEDFLFKLNTSEIRFGTFQTKSDTVQSKLDAFKLKRNIFQIKNSVLQIKLTTLIDSSDARKEHTV